MEIHPKLEVIVAVDPHQLEKRINEKLAEGWTYIRTESVAVGFDEDSRLLLPMPHEALMPIIEAERLESDDDGRLAAVIGPREHRQALRRLDDGASVRHEVLENDLADHGLLRGGRIPLGSRRMSTIRGCLRKACQFRSGYGRP